MSTSIHILACRSSPVDVGFRGNVERLHRLVSSRLWDDQDYGIEGALEAFFANIQDDT
jgi:hypothetical protein